ncbi:MAG: biotin transporter BioY [Clostridiales bacterium]|jgi:biotin transport system substrate-specific component|nr:biotin transporter BioY [Clostridiales bacterium]
MENTKETKNAFITESTEELNSGKALPLKALKLQTRQIALCGLFAALTAVLSPFSIPIGPVPINLATFSVMCAGAVLGAKYGFISQLVYLLVGVLGVPVFSNFSSGPAKLIGPTGGYLIGYLAAAWLIGFITQRAANKRRVIIPAMAAGAVCYLTLGTLWYMYMAKVNAAGALAVCVIPFLPGDLIKLAAASEIAYRVRGILR